MRMKLKHRKFSCLGNQMKDKGVGPSIHMIVDHFTALREISLTFGAGQIPPHIPNISGLHSHFINLEVFSPLPINRHLGEECKQKDR